MEDDKVEARFIIELAGKPVGNVEKALEAVKKQLCEEKEKFKVLEIDLGEPEYEENSTLYTGFVEVLIKFYEPNKILEFIMDYTPTSVEVEEPEKINLDSTSLTGILNDFSMFILKSQSEIRKLRAHAHMLNKKLKKE